jgi:Na+-transporting NADH:ubiquinone oxidoreductase subunit C
MNKQSNVYTLVYIIILVVVVGAALAFTAISLKDRQQANADADKMRQILASVNIRPAADSIIADYEKFVIESYVVNADGTRDNSIDAFDVNVAQEIKKPDDKRLLPVFVCRLADGNTKYIIPLYGAGLWGPIWGYISLDSDASTLYGAYFAHQGETPGLGAEIEKPAFSGQFKGKRLVKDGAFMPVTVVKAGQKPSGSEDYVDGVSGGTITSKGVAAMLDNCIRPYKTYLEDIAKK